jgi:hypothetical protein
LQEITDFYEDWSVGSPGDIWFDSDNLVNNAFPSDPSTLSLPATVSLTSDSSPLADRSLYTNDYILFVHGWNNTPAERRGDADVAYERLYWQGFKGRFGMFNWPTGSGITGILSALENHANFDDSTYVAFESGGALLYLIEQLDDHGYSVNLLAHSLGNIVASEALTIAADFGLGQVVNTYIASQAAVPSDAYDPSLSGTFAATYPTLFSGSTADMWSRGFQTININGDITTGSFTLTYAGYSTASLSVEATAQQVQDALNALPSASGQEISVISGGPGIYGVTISSAGGGPMGNPGLFTGIGSGGAIVSISAGPYFGNIGQSAEKLYNFYNPDDGAVAATDIWPLDQATKPDGGFSSGAGGSTFYSGSTMLNPLVGSSLWEILSYASNVYSTGLGATANVGGPFTTAGQVNLETQLPAGAQFTSSLADHSAEFEHDNAFTQYYWNLVMKRMGLLNTNDWPDLTPTLGTRP